MSVLEAWRQYVLVACCDFLTALGDSIRAAVVAAKQGLARCGQFVHEVSVVRADEIFRTRKSWHAASLDIGFETVLVFALNARCVWLVHPSFAIAVVHGAIAHMITTGMQVFRGAAIVHAKYEMGLVLESVSEIAFVVIAERSVVTTMVRVGVVADEALTFASVGIPLVYIGLRTIVGVARVLFATTCVVISFVAMQIRAGDILRIVSMLRAIWTRFRVAHSDLVAASFVVGRSVAASAVGAQHLLGLPGKHVLARAHFILARSSLIAASLRVVVVFGAEPSLTVTLGMIQL
jgi:hypothetical protein